MIDKALPKFLRNNPKTKEEKLIMELIKDLDAVTHAFMKLNHSGNLTQEFFVILKDASIGYAGAMVRDLAKMLSIKEQQKYFLEEAQSIYLAYIEDVKEDLL